MTHDEELLMWYHHYQKLLIIHGVHEDRERPR